MFAAFGTKAVKIYPVKELSKQQIVDMLPKELRALTWSCRKPLYDQQGWRPSMQSLQGLQRNEPVSV